MALSPRLPRRGRQHRRTVRDTATRILGHQLTVLLAAIRALHLKPALLTQASFAGISGQQHSLSGD